MAIPQGTWGQHGRLLSVQPDTLLAHRRMACRASTARSCAIQGDTGLPCMLSQAISWHGTPIDDAPTSFTWLGH